MASRRRADRPARPATRAGRPGKPAAPRSRRAAAASKATPRSAAARAPSPAPDLAPAAFLAALPEPRRSELTRIDRFVRDTLPDLERVVRSGMLGYGPFHYRYASGREGDTVKIGLASRAQYVSLYTCAADARGHVAERYRARLPGADIGKGCVRFRRFDDLDPEVLRELLLEVDRVGYEP
ncbi:MAG: DUF1801 domain-containing protein [Anaeromyxobacter sp.]|nr:DUF1801 domain-containing protein [Anaeromyxobacter sp.]MBL0275079.1 DUF1801 domain-containing protein [Anaeromyxobacter sp.]